ncbi:MAG: DUF3563 family protein [Piscinibacter sp.]|nr:DUF3563 family protein [Piscinibacter sp.]
MQDLLNLLHALLPRVASQQERDAAYLAAAADTPDLERRLREIDARGRRWSPLEHGLYPR